MMRGFLKDSPPGMQFLFTMMVVIASWLVFQLLAVLTGMYLYGIGFTNITGVIMNPETPAELAFLKYLQTFISLGMFGASSFIIAWYLSEHPVRFLGLSRIPDTTVFLLVALLVFLSLPFSNYLTYLNGRLSLGGGLQWLQDYIVSKESSINSLMEKFLDVKGVMPLLVNIFVIAIIPAIGEELLFRGVLQGLFIRWIKNVHAGIFITALLFGFFHFQFLSFLPRFYLGMVFGYLFYWTGSLWITMFAHFLNNGMAVMFYYFYYGGITGRSMDDLGTPDSHQGYALLSLSVVLVILLVIRRIRKEKGSFSQY